MRGGGGGLRRPPRHVFVPRASLLADDMVRDRHVSRRVAHPPATEAHDDLRRRLRRRRYRRVRCQRGSVSRHAQCRLRARDVRVSGRGVHWLLPQGHCPGGDVVAQRAATCHHAVADAVVPCGACSGADGRMRLGRPVGAPGAVVLHPLTNGVDLILARVGTTVDAICCQRTPCATVRATAVGIARSGTARVGEHISPEAAAAHTAPA